MKSFLQNLLIFLALCLCGVMVIQWVRETHLHKKVQDLYDDLHSKAESIQNLQATVRRDETEIQRLDALKNELTDTLKSNKLEISSLAKDLEKATNEAEKNQRQAEVYKEALDKANENLLKQNEDIKRQNEDMKRLIAERAETISNFNKMASDYNTLASNWNKLQEDLARAATNTPAKK
jgi:chromosome segregation ATPase